MKCGVRLGDFVMARPDTKNSGGADWVDGRVIGDSDKSGMVLVRYVSGDGFGVKCLKPYASAKEAKAQACLPLTQEVQAETRAALASLPEWQLDGGDICVGGRVQLIGQKPRVTTNGYRRELNLPKGVEPEHLALRCGKVTSVSCGAKGAVLYLSVLLDALPGDVPRWGREVMVNRGSIVALPSNQASLTQTAIQPPAAQARMQHQRRQHQLQQENLQRETQEGLAQTQEKQEQQRQQQEYRNLQRLALHQILGLRHRQQLEQQSQEQGYREQQSQEQGYREQQSQEQGYREQQSQEQEYREQQYWEQEHCEQELHQQWERQGPLHHGLQPPMQQDWQMHPQPAVPAALSPAGGRKPQAVAQAISAADWTDGFSLVADQHQFTGRGGGNNVIWQDQQQGSPQLLPQQRKRPYDQMHGISLV